MTAAMVGAHSAGLLTASAFVAIAASLFFARSARRNPTAREYIVDLWAMALVALTLVPGQAHEFAAGFHDHFALPGGLAAFVVVYLGWVASRFFLLRSSPLSPTSSLLTGGITAASLAAMAVFCG
ncbi:MAG: hypothetical protein JWR53_883 [Glaciihabitans sp.]|nr:hypothetical protein [Glaciihabitans sp.]